MRQPDSGEYERHDPEGSVLVLIDESFDPYVAAAAVVIESSEAQRMNSDIAGQYATWKGSYYLEGLPNFEEFQRRGFHAAADPREVKSAFINFLADTLSFKTFIIYSDGSGTAQLSKKQRLMMVLDRLVRDVMRTYHGRQRITFLFESADILDKYIERVVMRAAKAVRRRGPEIVVEFGKKRNPDLLALPDYVLHVFNQWRWNQPSDQPVMSPEDYRSRFFRAIQGSVSSARSLEGSSVIRRAIDD